MKILFIFGTRPEAIKMAPIIKALVKKSNVDVRVCVTGQHRQMLDQVLSFFSIVPDYDLDLMKPDQSLFDITAHALGALASVFRKERPDVVVVQGDTTTAFVGALGAYYSQVRVAHVEAGLRSHSKYSPFPEEMNRVLVGRLADYHFAPTESAADNLRGEGLCENVWVVGNPVIDALHLGLEIIQRNGEDDYRKFFGFLNPEYRTILVTGHRRESFGTPFENVCSALKRIIEENPDIQMVYPVHLNPSVREPVYRLIGGHPRIHLIEPLSYPHLLWLMNRSYFVITDSGGIQEEAPALGKPVLVTRDVTERMEGVEAGNACLVGTDADRIVARAKTLLTNRAEYEAMARAINPYGDGRASERIAGLLTEDGNAKQ